MTIRLKSNKWSFIFPHQVHSKRELLDLVWGELCFVSCCHLSSCEAESPNHTSLSNGSPWLPRSWRMIKRFSLSLSLIYFLFHTLSFSLSWWNISIRYVPPVFLDVKKTKKKERNALLLNFIYLFIFIWGHGGLHRILHVITELILSWSLVDWCLQEKNGHSTVKDVPSG